MRWAPLAMTVAVVTALQLRSGTPVTDLARFFEYAVGAVLLPGILVFRSLRRTPHTLVEDLAFGAAVGLCLEVGAWSAYSALDLRGWLWTWPAAIVAAFLLVPQLRRHWWVRGYTPVPPGWAWTVAAVVSSFTAYLSVVFIDRNPILPGSEFTRQYLDLPYQLSLAGEATHRFPPALPQVAGEALPYHWFGYAHMAATSMIAHIDLPVVALRLAIPALCAAAIVLTGVVGWRISGRPAVGAVAAVLFFAIGEVNFTHPVTMPFGTQVTFVIWHGMSMIYSWVLLIAVIAPLAEIVRGRQATGRRVTGPPPAGASNPIAPHHVTPRPVPELGSGAWGLVALLLLASSGAKASSLPVIAVALALTAIVLLVARRRIPWPVVGAGLLTGAAQLFATAVLYRFQTYGVGVGLFSGLSPFWSDAGSDLPHWLVVAGVWIAFGVNMFSRAAGIVALLWVRRGRLDPAQWFLLAGGLGGPGLYLVLSQPSSGNQYFVRAGFTFAVLLSAWGYVVVLDRARIHQRGRQALGVGAGLLASSLTVTQLGLAGPGPVGGSAIAPLAPLLTWVGFLAVLLGVGAVLWRTTAARVPAMRGRGGLVALTAILVVGAPGLVMDGYKSAKSPNGGAYATIALPASRVEVARWVRDHSQPTDVVATNVHCLGKGDTGWCDSRSFWLSAYAERSVYVEGWAFAPRIAGQGLVAFWDAERLAKNDGAIYAPTSAGLADLWNQGVRWLVIDRATGREAAELASLARLRHEVGNLVVYELVPPAR